MLSTQLKERVLLQQVRKFVNLDEIFPIWNVRSISYCHELPNARVWVLSTTVDPHDSRRS